MTIPFHVSLMSKFIAVPVYPNSINEAKGEIIRMHFAGNKENHAFNYQVVGSEDGYDIIYRHIAHDYWKIISKVKERTC